MNIRVCNALPAATSVHWHGLDVSNDMQPCARLCKNTIVVSSGETWDIEFCPDNPDNWPLHCHIPYHSANNMTKETGGMLTVVRYRCRWIRHYYNSRSYLG